MLTQLLYVLVYVSAIVAFIVVPWLVREWFARRAYAQPANPVREQHGVPALEPKSPVEQRGHHETQRYADRFESRLIAYSLRHPTPSPTAGCSHRFAFSWSMANS